MKNFRVICSACTTYKECSEAGKCLKSMLTAFTILWFIALIYSIATLLWLSQK